MKKIILFLFFIICFINFGETESAKQFNIMMQTLKNGKNNQDNNNQNKINMSYDQDILTELFPRIEYTILKASEYNNKSILTVEMKTPNLFRYFFNIVDHSLDLTLSGVTVEELKDGIKRKIHKILLKPDLKYYTGIIQVNMIKKNNTWQLDEKNDELYMYLTGGLTKFLEIKE